VSGEVCPEANAGQDATSVRRKKQRDRAGNMKVEVEFFMRET
jgi:hypothetical protein